jgi:threonine dehydrogenase-like Zn-dependent dehydrogenase
MVGRVLAAGSQSGFEEGTVVLSHTPHQSVARFDCRDVICVRVPEALSVDVAPFARLGQVAGVSLQASSARPGDVVCVVGLGPVGNLGAQLAACSGFAVVGVEVSAARREVARSCGLSEVVGPEEAEAALEEKGRARVVIECSGRAGAVALSTRLCARYGEIWTVGAPWRTEEEVPANTVLAALFEQFLALRSGWEWQVPRYGRGPSRSVASCTRWVLDRLADGSLKTSPLLSASLMASEAGRAYELLDVDPEHHLTFLLDWAALERSPA